MQSQRQPTDVNRSNYVLQDALLLLNREEHCDHLLKGLGVLCHKTKLYGQVPDGLDRSSAFDHLLI